ncbi:protein NRT1/ PTR FAMILY 2.6-like [Carica papaya]|uniref:protein NRT1/ PTR FAMILY 2.6-like n=1 Tax=Carica papaya TaxID=3649 RepID=UPI000B8C9D58|nr:protein NRT1/ PTR FAMILY 2.6-like [Carica papaya]
MFLCRVTFLWLLFNGIFLAAVGTGDTPFTIATVGANQFKKAKDRGIFFYWFFFTIYVSSMVSSMVIVYIEDNVSWGLDFGVCLAANLIGLATFILGKRFYHHVRPQGSPFKDIVRVIVAAIRKRKVVISSENENYYHEHDETLTVESRKPKDSFRFLNAAALITQMA